MFRCDGQQLDGRLSAGESDSGLFGGNSNWRGPIWFPVNYLIIESLQKFHHYYGDDFKVECPTGSGNYLTIDDVADELSRRLTRLFPARRERPPPGVRHNATNSQTDPHFRDYLLFHEYFHGDNGRGVGASHQTGWTGLIAKLLQPRRPEGAGECERHLPPAAQQTATDAGNGSGDFLHKMTAVTHAAALGNTKARYDASRVNRH